MEIINILKLTYSIQSILNKKAKEYFDATGGFNGKSGIVKSIEYNQDYVVFFMEENELYIKENKNPQTTYLCLFFDKLNLNDEEWQIFLYNTRCTYKQQQEEEKEKEEYNTYLRLKEEFDNFAKLKIKYNTKTLRSVTNLEE